MYSIRKLKPDRNFYGMLLPFAVLAIGALFGFLFGLGAAFYLVAVFFWIFALYSLLTFFRTRNPGFIVVALYQLTVGAMSFLMPERIGGPRDPAIIF